MDDTTKPASELAAMLTHNSGFDYSTIEDEAVRQAARKAADEILGVLIGSSRNIGKVLLRMKKILPHGQFAAWYETEFGMSSSTAARYMADAKAFADSQFPTVGKLRANTRDQLAHVKDKAERDRIVTDIGNRTLTNEEDIRQRVKEARAKEPKKTASKSAKAAAASDTASDQKKLKLWADKAIAILRELGSEKFEEFRDCFNRAGINRFKVALAEAKFAAPSIVKAAAEPAAATVH